MLRHHFASRPGPVNIGTSMLRHQLAILLVPVNIGSPMLRYDFAINGPRSQGTLPTRLMHSHLGTSFGVPRWLCIKRVGRVPRLLGHFDLILDTF